MLGGDKVGSVEATGGVSDGAGATEGAGSGVLGLPITFARVFAGATGCVEGREEDAEAVEEMVFSIDSDTIGAGANPV